MEKMLLFSVIRTWNDIQKEMKGVMLNTFSLAKLKSLLIEFYLYKKFLAVPIYIYIFSKIKLLRIGLSLSVVFKHILLQ